MGLTFKMVMCDQPKRHHKGKFLKEENIYFFISARDRMVLLTVKVHSTCGLSSRLTLAGGGGRGGEDEGGVFVTTRSGPPCGFTV